MIFAVLASGQGSNLRAILRAVKSGKIRASLRVVFSDKPDAPALEHARRAGVPVVAHLPPRDYASREDFDAAVVALLQREGVELVVLAGYMRLVSPVFLKAFPDRVLNIHPALLPAFRGAHALADALAYGVKVTGVTVHLVDEEVDHGPVLAQVPVLIRPDDTPESLAARVHRAEHRLYPRVIELFALGKVQVDGRRCRIRD